MTTAKQKRPIYPIGLFKIKIQIKFKMFAFLIKKSELCLELLEAISANSLVVEVNNVVGVSAEYAGGLVFLKDDLIVVGEDLNGVLYVDIHYFSYLDGENDSSKLVYFSYNSG